MILFSPLFFKEFWLVLDFTTFWLPLLEYKLAISYIDGFFYCVDLFVFVL